jgi:hypothetical protein
MLENVTVLLSNCAAPSRKTPATTALDAKVAWVMENRLAQSVIATVKPSTHAPMRSRDRSPGVVDASTKSMRLSDTNELPYVMVPCVSETKCTPAPDCSDTTHVDMVKLNTELTSSAVAAGS